MTGAKGIYDKVHEEVVTKIADAKRNLDAAGQNFEPLRSRVTSGQDEKAKKYLSSFENSFNAARNDVEQISLNIEVVKERLELKKVSYEAREIAARSWPSKTWIERITWVATALFPSGGVGFVFAGGLTYASLAFAIGVWTAATIALVTSLLALKREDERKWNFFKREFDIDIEQTERRGFFSRVWSH